MAPFSMVCSLFAAALLAITILDVVNNNHLLGFETSWSSLLPAAFLLVLGIVRRERIVFLVIAGLLIVMECYLIYFRNGVAAGGAAVFKML